MLFDIDFFKLIHFENKLITTYKIIFYNILQYLIIKYNNFGATKFNVLDYNLIAKFHSQPRRPLINFSTPNRITFYSDFTLPRCNLIFSQLRPVFQIEQIFNVRIYLRQIE